MMPLRVVMSMLFIGSCLCSPTLLAEEHTQDTVPEVIAAVKEKKAVLVDVREKSEWDKGHLKGAKLVPLSALKKDLPAEEIRKLVPKNAIVYVHCASGYRCLEAAPLLRKYGYEVRALSTGYKGLLQAGLPPAPPEKPKAEQDKVE